VPEAAWCSACQKYVWVSPEGRCQLGHGPEFLSARYVDDTQTATVVGTDGAAAAAPQPSPPPPFAEPAWTPIPAPTPAGAAAPPSAIPLEEGLTRHMWRRLAAFSFDYLISQLVALGIVFLVFFIYALFQSDSVPAAWTEPAAGILSVVLFLTYFIVSEGLFSTTLGKRLFGLRVVSTTAGGQITWRQSATRNLLLIADLLFLGLAGIAAATSSPWRQRLGDKAAATLVIRSAPEVAYLPLSPESLKPAQTGPAFTRWGIILISVVVVLFGSAIAAGLWATFEPESQFASDAQLAETASPSDASAPSGQSGTGESGDVPPAADAVLTEFVPMTVGEWDAYIAREYPGYRVKERIETPNQWRKGILGVNYVLVNEKQPKFTLLVTLTQLRLDQSLEDVPDGFLDVNDDDIATSDGLFSAEMARNTSYLSGKAQDAIIESYVAEKPDETAVAFGGFGDEGTVNFGVATGTQAVARTIRSFENWDYIAESPIPSGPDNATVDVSVSPL